MHPFFIEPTEDRPKVVLDDQNQIFLFEGESRPPHTFKFYQPIINWLEEYRKILFWQREHFGKNRRMTVQFKLTYFHSTSAKFIADIFFILDSFCKDGFDVRVKWYYNREDTDMLESAEEYSKMVSKLPVKLVVVEDPETED
jgi:hypothetical protein